MHYKSDAEKRRCKISEVFGKEWISVEEALPEKFHPVLLLLELDRVALGFYDGEWGAETPDGWFYRDDVTHWMPLSKAADIFFPGH